MEFHSSFFCEEKIFNFWSNHALSTSFLHCFEINDVYVIDGSWCEVICYERGFHGAYSYAEGQYEEIGLYIKSFWFVKAQL